MDKNILEGAISKGLSTYGLSVELNTSQTNVRYWLRKHGLNTQNLSKDKAKKDCLNGNKCKCCGKDLTGAKSMYCSNNCKVKFHYTNQTSVNGNTNERQKTVSKERKLECIKIKGGSCEHCGYKSNSAVLQFHHRDPENKSFTLDSRKLSNTKWSSILLELDKCDLLCSNCHIELHNPDKKMVGAMGLEPITVQDGFDEL